VKYCDEITDLKNELRVYMDDICDDDDVCCDEEACYCKEED